MAIVQQQFNYQKKINKIPGVIPPETGQIIVQYAQEALKDHRVHNEARRLVARIYDQNDATIHQVKDAETIARLSEIAAIYNHVTSRVRYTYDPVGVELVYHPSYLYAKNGPIDKHGKWAEDCDTISLLVMTFLLSLGHQARITIVGFPGPAMYGHVFAESYIRGLGWFVVDPALGPKVPSMLQRIVRFQHFYPEEN